MTRWAHYGSPRCRGSRGRVEAAAREAAGLQAGDIITRAGGERVETASTWPAPCGTQDGRFDRARDLARSRGDPRDGEGQRRPGYDYEFDLGDLERHLGRDIGREIGRHAWAFRDGPIVFRDRRVLRDRPENLDRLHEKLEKMEKRLRDLEKRLSSR
jgi:hypothetical protein